MNLKKLASLLFVLLLGAGSVAFAANNTRNVYSVYSDNFNGAHIYGAGDSIPTSDKDGLKIYPWKTEWQTPSHLTMTISAAYATDSDPAPEGKGFLRCFWGSMEGSTPYTYNYVGCGFNSIQGVGTQSSVDMSAFTGGQIKFSARSNKSYGNKCQIGISTIDGGDYWFPTLLTNISSTWQEFSFSIPSSVAANLNKVKVLFMFRIEEPQGTTHTVGEEFLNIDNIRWVKNNAGATFYIVRKNTSDNSVVSDQTAPISFSEDSFGQGWTVADQYIEMDVDGEFTGNNWVIRAYTNNDKAGLYNISDTSDVLPTAWKVSCSTLPYVYTDYNDQGTPFQNKNTLEIGEKKSQSGEFYGLYDQGKVDFLHNTNVEWLFPWFFVKTTGDTSAQSIIFNNQGCHTFENTDAGGIVHEYYDALTDFHERKPKLFFACDTKKAIAAKYTASFTISLSYE